MMANAMRKMTIQPYPRGEDGLLSKHELFPQPSTPTRDDVIDAAIERAFLSSRKDKKGILVTQEDSPNALVARCLKHLRERSDPVLSSHFVGSLKADEIFGFDAVSHEMQRHRMRIGLFYQQLLLEMFRLRWPATAGYDETDMTVEIDTPSMESGLKLYVSVKKSIDTVGGQDVAGAIANLEKLPKNDKNLNRPYLCVVAIATPSRGKLLSYTDDRKVKRNKHDHPISVNCEYWGPGFLFPFLTGHAPQDIYVRAYRQVGSHFPFRSLQLRAECAALLDKELRSLNLVTQSGLIDAERFLQFVAPAANPI